jgi:hypothetical protein
MRKVLLMLLALLAFMGFSAATGLADEGSGGGGPSCSQGPGNNCDDHAGDCDSSGPGNPCNNDGENCDKSGPGGDCNPGDGNDDDGNPPMGGCPPATGPISGIVQSVSDAVRNGGLGPVADLVDQINCRLLVDVLHVSASGTGL